MLKAMILKDISIAVITIQHRHLQKPINNSSNEDINIHYDISNISNKEGNVHL